MSKRDYRKNAPAGLTRTGSSASSRSSSSLPARRQSVGTQQPSRAVGYTAQPTRAPMPSQQQQGRAYPAGSAKVVSVQPPRVQQMKPVPPPASHQVQNGRRPSFSRMRINSCDGTHHHHHHHHHQNSRQPRRRADWTRNPCLKTCGIGLVLGIGACLVTAGVGTAKACTYCCRGPKNSNKNSAKTNALLNGGRGGDGNRNKSDKSDLLEECWDLTQELLDCDGCCSGDCCFCCGSPSGEGDCCSGDCCGGGGGGGGGGGDCCSGGGGGGSCP